MLLYLHTTMLQTCQEDTWKLNAAEVINQKYNTAYESGTAIDGRKNTAFSI